MPLNLAGLLAGSFLDVGGPAAHAGSFLDVGDPAVHNSCSSTSSAGLGCEGVSAVHATGGHDTSAEHHGDFSHTWDAMATAGAARAARRGRYASFINSSFMCLECKKSQGIHFHAPIDSAFATSTYTNALNGGGPSNIYGPARALAPGSGYWCSSGHHNKSEIVSWKGFLHKRRPISGMKISWAYAPGEVRVRTTPDTLHWDTVVKWHKPLKGEVSFEEDLVFDRPRNVMAVNVDMRKPKDWGYYGINQATLVM